MGKGGGVVVQMDSLAKLTPMASCFHETHVPNLSRHLVAYFGHESFPSFTTPLATMAPCDMCRRLIVPLLPQRLDYYCDLCELWMHSTNVERHRVGKKHKKRLRAQHERFQEAVRATQAAGNPKAHRRALKQELARRLENLERERATVNRAFLSARGAPTTIAALAQHADGGAAML